jgi:uncharacterized protein YgiB involved in biofilm formation
MKRSRHIALLGMGVSTLVLTACGSDNKVDIATSTYSSVADCVSAKVLTEAQCNRAFEVAVDVHDETAPRFETLKQCEEVAGENKCERGPSQSSSTSTNPTYRPSFVSFIVPHIGPSAGVQPLYPQRNTVGLAPATTIAQKASTLGFKTHAPKAVTLSRNGFGTTTARSSWFSTSSS